MGTDIRPEISEQNKYWIDRHRYYELKHFCLQYPLWKRAYNTINGLSERTPSLAGRVATNNIYDPTIKCVEARLYYSDRMQMIERAAEETDPFLAQYILKAVSGGISYDALRTKYCIPCCKDVYYEAYRRFFWLLSRARK